ncbi:MAG: NAD(P)-binding protein [Bacteroidetes bacterium]|jgi:monoamine oxidase|nr:NAD(P)-binding protein [Bacteroidota bacterium]
MSKPDVLIMGGGLTGLLIAYLLQREGVPSTILEARSRLGGRIHTMRPAHEAPLEMGATWLGKKHHHVLNLLDDLDIEIVKQYMGTKGFYEPMSVTPPQLVDLPPADEPSYRIAGGTESIITTLAAHLDESRIQLNQPVKAILKTGTGLEIQTDTDCFTSDIVVSTLPPKLLVETIQWSPSLPNELMEIASKTHTWMAESIKVALTFEKPFWRSSESSGTIFSNVGPVTELYDHSGNNRYALKGFMNSAYQTVPPERRKQLVLEQLHRFYGHKADSFLSYRECVWAHEPFTFTPYQPPVVPHQNNGHPVFRQPYLDRRFLIAGSETASEFPGYMDGAVESANHALSQIIDLISG